METGGEEKEGQGAQAEGEAQEEGPPPWGGARPGHCNGAAILGMTKAPTPVHRQRKDAINGNSANKGARMLVTNQMALLFRRHVVEERRQSSPQQPC